MISSQQFWGLIRATSPSSHLSFMHSNVKTTGPVPASGTDDQLATPPQLVSTADMYLLSVPFSLTCFIMECREMVGKLNFWSIMVRIWQFLKQIQTQITDHIQVKLSKNTFLLHIFYNRSYRPQSTSLKLQPLHPSWRCINTFLENSYNMWLSQLVQTCRVQLMPISVASYLHVLVKMMMDQSSCSSVNFWIRWTRYASFTFSGVRMYLWSSSSTVRVLLTIVIL